jgi:5-methylcytosine-specific restriction endonuclease McrA
MIQINEIYYSAQLKKFNSKIEYLNSQVFQKLINFKGNQSSKLSHEQLRYLNSLIFNFRKKDFNLIRLSIKEIKHYKNAIGKVPTGNIVYKNKATEFNKIISGILNYSELRNKFLPEFYHSLNIKTCVYCNANFTTTIEKEKGVFESKFQFDHILSQDDYPHFSISIFNLVPSCFKCNNTKRNKTINFQLYSENIPKNEYKFSLNKLGIINYFKTFDNSKIEIIFFDPNYVSKKLNSLEHNFNISKIYKEHKDIAEEIIIKSYIYNESYVKDLSNFMDSKFTNLQIPFNRLFIGNYMEERESLKRPLSKFTQDIFKEVQILKTDIDNILK